MRKIINPYIGREDEGYNCFACAPHNPHGLKMEFYEDGEDIVCFWTPSKDYQSWQDTLHGGIQATLIDETAGWLITRKFETSGMTTSFNLKYRKPVAAGEGHTVEVRVRTREVKRNFVFMDATLKCDGELCTTAEVTFFCFSQEVAREKYLFRPCQLEQE